jgi:hypothetical protein
MGARIAGLAVLLACALAAHKNESPKIGDTRGENESVVIKATVYADPEAVKQVLGSDLDGHYIVVDLQVTPRFGKEVTISRDDFVLKTDKDGEKSTPFAPSQIAGRSALVISQTRGGGGGGMHNNDGPIWGGYPGSTGVPRRVGGDGTTVGGAPGAEGAQARMKSGSKDKPNPLLKVLKDKELPEAKTAEPVSGLLYFPMEKQKIKELELRYNLPEDKIVMRFHQEH